MINVLIIISGIILLLGLLYYEKKKDRMPLLIVKSLLSLLFVMTALLQPHPVPVYYHYLFVGLIFCLIGDVCLAAPSFKVHADPRIAIYRGDHRDGIRSLGGFLEILLPNLRKGIHLYRIP